MQDFVRTLREINLPVPPPSPQPTITIQNERKRIRQAEGPAYFRAGRYLIFSDIPNNRMMRLLENDNHLNIFRSPSLHSNGNTVDLEGRLVTCEHSGRRVTRTELDGTVTVIADRFNGNRLNSPNDVVVASNGSIWFTDPTYGIKGNYEGLKSEPDQDNHNVFRVDGKTGKVTVVIDDFVQPNGIVFSPDEKRLYITDSGLGDGGPSHIRMFDVDIETGKVRGGKVFADDFAQVQQTACAATLKGTFGAAWGGPIRKKTVSAATVPRASCLARYTCLRPPPT
jgi:gluconolactonase